MVILCDEKCPYCGAQMEDINTPVKKYNIVMHIKECSAHCEMKRELQKQRIKNLKVLRKKYKEAQFKTRKRLKNYYGPYKAEARVFVNCLNSTSNNELFLIGIDDKEKELLTEIISKEAIAKGLKYVNMSLPEYLSKLQEASCYNAEISFDEQIKQWIEKDLIILANFGLGEYSGKKIENTFILIKRVIKAGKPLIITARPEDIARLKNTSAMKPIFDLLREQMKVLTFK